MEHWEATARSLISNCFKQRNIFWLVITAGFEKVAQLTGILKAMESTQSASGSMKNKHANYPTITGTLCPAGSVEATPTCSVILSGGDGVSSAPTCTRPCFFFLHCYSAQSVKLFSLIFYICGLWNETAQKTHYLKCISFLHVSFSFSYKLGALQKILMKEWT